MPAKRVLIVDDQQDMREMARLGMLAGGWNVLTAASGREALTMAASELLDIILLDVMMPDMNGPSTVLQLQADQRTRAIPVVLLTADEHVSSQPGVIGTIAKPFHPLKLAAQVSRILETVA